MSKLGAEWRIDVPQAEYAYQVVVNPWRPCEMFRTEAADQISRSSDGGRSWQVVFQDDATGYQVGAAQPAPFHAHTIQVIGPHEVIVGESGNGDAVLVSRDDGAHWSLSDSGLQGEPIMSFATSASDPSTIYAVAAPVGTAGFGPTDLPGLYLSRDGGQTWSATNFPRIPDLGAWQVFPGAFQLIAGTQGVQCGNVVNPPCDAFPQVQVDPTDPAHLWIMVDVPSDGAESLLLQSKDYGQTWGLVSQLNAAYTQLLVTASRTHGVRLYASDYPGVGAGGALNPPVRSDNGGTSWSPLPVGAYLSNTALAADPADPDVMMFAGVHAGLSQTNAYGFELTGWFSRDGFDSSIPAGVGTTLDATDDPPNSPLAGGFTEDGSIVLQADRLGNFYAALDVDCPTTTACDPRKPGRQVQSYFRYSPPPPPRPSTSADDSRASGAGGSYSQTYGTPMQEVRVCPTPVLQTKPEVSYGNLGFDGQSLLFTQYGDTGTQPYTGVIHRTDPYTCKPESDVTVQFSAADLQRVAQVTGAPDSGVHPYIDTMTYDPNDDTLWLSLATTPVPGQDSVVGIFTAKFVNGPTGPRSLAVAALQFFKPHCSGPFGEGEDLFAFDFSDATLWACDFPDGKQPPPTSPLGGLLPVPPPTLPALPILGPQPGSSTPDAGQPAHVDASGTRIRSCLDNSDFAQLATWVVGAPGRLYIQMEDDTTVVEVDDHTCATVQTYSHRSFGEPSGEDEQMACDSITFGQEAINAGGSPVTTPTSVIWIRDAVKQVVIAYAIPDSTCPYPTVTHFIGPVRVARGEMANLCANLSRAGIPRPLGAEVLDFQVNGREVGEGYTNNAGEACVKTLVTLAAGTYPVTASFAGTKEWYPSGDTGSLIVDDTLYVAVPPPPPPVLLIPSAGLTPLLHHPAPLTAANPNAAANPAVQPQTQPQGQQQAQANLQPGASAQHEQQVQPQAAMAMIPEEQQQGLSYAMSSLRGDDQTEAIVGLSLGGVFAGIFGGLLAWTCLAPRRAWARRSRRR